MSDFDFGSMKRRDLLIHILCWSIVLFLPLVFYRPSDTTHMRLMHWFRSLGGSLSYMVIFYINYLWLIPKYYFGHKRKAFVLLNVLFIALAVAMAFGWWNAINSVWPSDRPFRDTLNNIYALIAFAPQKAQEAVEELSKLLRHVLYENQQNFVPLYKEVAFMNNYIELMKIRVTHNVTIEQDIDISPDDATPIAPLIFISLIENAFKHGISPAGTGTIKVKLHKGSDHSIVCEITNTNFPKRANDKSGSGIGLQQVKKRLELMYHGHYTWKRGTSHDGKVYQSRITIVNGDGAASPMPAINEENQS